MNAYLESEENGILPDRFPVLRTAISLPFPAVNAGLRHAALGVGQVRKDFFVREVKRQPLAEPALESQSSFASVLQERHASRLPTENPECPGL
ncbi:MAG: hypothetical protein LBO79_09915 [Zoogloeaceae bacterium]|jgi:hypothetical protein|nr:hypothetical protein [Zoogloeaceae bacterium]